MTSLSFVAFAGDGTTGPFSVPFSYLDKAHVGVTVDGVAVGFSWTTDSAVALDAAAPAGVLVEIRRTTPREERLVDFTDGSVLLEADLDLGFLQQLYIAQEVLDAVENSVTRASDGTYTAGGKRITDLADPEDDQDAVTKGYVDAVSGAASANAAATSAAEAEASALSAAASAAAAATFGPENYYTTTEIDGLLDAQSDVIDGLLDAQTHVKADITDLAAATLTEPGLVEKSTSAENVGGTASDVFPDVAGVKEMIETHGGNLSGLRALDDITYTASGTLTKASDLDPDATHVLIECWGGGGSGGQGGSGIGAGGGGGGEYRYTILAVGSLGTSETVTVGAGGASRTTADTSGASGGTTSFGALLSASGGAGGNIEPTVNGGAGANGGGENSAGSVFGGGAGGRGGAGGKKGGSSGWGGAGGGGGGSADGAGNGGDSYHGGNGGAGRTGGTNAVAGSQPGGGGGGSEAGNSGRGGAGQARVRSFAFDPSDILGAGGAGGAGGVSMSDNEILLALRNVDGTGSGLDADLLDGNEAAAFAAADHGHTLSDVSDAGALAALNMVGATEIDDGAVSNAKLADMAGATVKGRASGAGTGAPSDLTAAELRALLNVQDGATGDMSGEDILAALEDVDGVGSGLDADRLDGNHASAFAAADHPHSADDITSGALAVERGGTGAGDAATARSNLGVDAAILDAGPNLQTGTSYTLALSDNGKIVSMNNGSANTLTIPANATVAFPVGATVNVVMRGTGATTIQAAGGVSLNGVSAGGGAIQTQFQGVSLYQETANSWIASGDIGSVS